LVRRGNTFPAEHYPALEAELLELRRARVPYVVGGRTRADGLDCAGLVAHVCATVGYELEYDDMGYASHWYRETAAGEHYLKQLTRNFDVNVHPCRPPGPGALLLFRIAGPSTPVSHTGFLLVDGTMIHTYDEGRGVCQTDPTMRFWADRYWGYATPKRSW
jgi:cell wall-associated NlpC family hydrolase